MIVSFKVVSYKTMLSVWLNLYQRICIELWVLALRRVFLALSQYENRVLPRIGVKLLQSKIISA